MHNKYDLPCIYFMYMYRVWQQQINIKMYGQIDVNMQYQFDANSLCQFGVSSSRHKSFHF